MTNNAISIKNNSIANIKLGALRRYSSLTIFNPNIFFRYNKIYTKNNPAELRNIDEFIINLVNIFLSYLLINSFIISSASFMTVPFAIKIEIN